MAEFANWEDEVVERTVRGFAELGAVPNVILVRYKSGEVGRHVFISSEQFEAQKQKIAFQKGDIEETVIISTGTVFWPQDDTSKQSKETTVLITTESRDDISVRMFRAEGKSLVRSGKVFSFKKSEIDVPSYLVMGLYEKRNEWSGMYA